MTYCDALYAAVFLPLTILIYNIVPQKHRWKVLLIASYIFFWSISGKLIIYLLLSTLSIHHFGLWLTSLQNERNNLLKEAEKDKKKEIRKQYLKKQRSVLLFAVILHIGLLIVLKYSKFLGTNINLLLDFVHLPIQLSIAKFALPIGISFYTFQAVSYMFDVYHEKIKADRNLGRLALFMAFFPQIMEGPICRYSDTAMQLYEGKKTTYKDLTFGIQRILWGFAKKMIIADRLNTLVKTVFTNYAQYDGGIIALGMILYTVQLYMDFSGTMDTVIGSAQIFGVKLPENFRQPFFSKSISDFWTRWHITLGAWFRDYIFYPLSLSEPLKKLTTKGRKKLGKHYGPLLASSIALFCVWISNGLWHGSAWSFIFFGMYHFGLILLGNIMEPVVKFVTEKLHINRECWPYRIFQIVRTTCLVFIGELFFRAKGLKAGLIMLKTIFTNFTFASFADGTFLKLGIDAHDFIIVAVFVVIVFITSIMKEKNINIREKIASKNIVIRWTLYYALILSIIIFGAYGVGYTPVDPMYASF